jgi:hypothetical protein
VTLDRIALVIERLTDGIIVGVRRAGVLYVSDERSRTNSGLGVRSARAHASAE